MLQVLLSQACSFYPNQWLWLPVCLAVVVPKGTLPVQQEVLAWVTIHNSPCFILIELCAALMRECIKARMADGF